MPAGAIGLTPRQRDLLAFLTRCPDASYREACEALGYASTQRIFDLANALQERGYIRRRPYRARSIQILRPLPIMIRGERFRFIPCGEG